MNSLKKFISEWFGYSRRERRASMILVIIIAVVILIRYTIPEKGIGVEVIALLPPSLTKEHISTGKKDTADPVRLVQFDPNTAAIGELTSLGIPLKVAGTLIRYRNSGGRFRRPEDIGKVYGMDSTLAETLIPYINIVQPERAWEKVPDPLSVDVPLRKSSPEARLQIDINNSDSAEVDALPGIGPVLSSRIIKYRELLGGFVAVGQLKEVYGISDSLFRVISGMISIDSSAVRRININSAGFSELDRHPYLERYDVQAILKYREIKGRIEGMNELKTNNILKGEKAARIFPYLLFI
jgi:competence protein ComEA